MSALPAPPAWPTSAGDPSLVEARLQAHHAAQLLAAFAGRFLEPRDDDAHRSLCWLPEQGALATGSASREEETLRVCLVLEAMRLTVRRGDEEVDGLELRGRTLDEARRWLTDRVSSGAHGPLPWPEFEIPAHPVAEGRPFDVDPAAAARLATWFAAAARVLAPVAARGDASPLRCWPHHFDIATLISVPTVRADGKTPAVGVGMAPGDGDYSAPYGYVSPWPPPWEMKRAPLVHGHWHTEGWLGAILPAQEWASDGGPSTVAAFYDDAIQASLELLR